VSKNTSGFFSSVCRVALFSIFFLTLAALWLLSAQSARAEMQETQPMYAQSIPLEFSRLEGLVKNAGGLALESDIKQEPGKPIVIECEAASAVHLWASEIARVRDDAGGRLAVRHALGLAFKFRTVEPGKYRFFLRVWNTYKACGPAYVHVDGKALDRLSQYPNKPKQWGWSRSKSFELQPGTHTIYIGGDTILWGSLLDRAVIAKAEAPAPDGMGPAATPAARDAGFAETSFVSARDVRRWLSTEATVVAEDGKVQWLARQDTNSKWAPVDIKDLSALKPDKPVQFRIEVTKNSGGTSPWVGPASVSFQGPPRKVKLAEGVTFVKNADGGCTVSTNEYTITFAPDGRIARLAVGSHDAIVPMKDNKGGGYFQERGRLIPLGRPLLQPDGSVASRSEGAALLWKFTRDAIRVDAVASAPGGGEFVMQVPDEAERIIDARTGRKAETIYEKGSPQIFFADGANVLCDDENQYGGKYGVRLTTRGVPDGPRFIGFWFNTANPWHKRLVLHAKPRPSDAIEMSVESPRADFIFPAGSPVQLDFPARMRYGMTFKGKAELSCNQMYPDPPAGKVVMSRTITLSSETKPVSWSVNLPKPGLYHTTLAIYDGESVAREMSTNICYGMDAVGGPPKPDDFDAFWAETKRKVAAMPLEFEKKKVHEDDKTILYVISYKAIDNKPGWAYLRVPKKAGRFPAVIMLPPVASRASAGYGYGDRVEMGVEVRGYNLTLSEQEGKKNPAIKYDPGSVAPGTKREDTWLYYAYCTMMRAYDILESRPEVDKKRIYITGVSQGGGLCLAVASLRPQNAGVLSIVGGLCRLDWRTANLGGWGPGAPEGPDRERILRDLSYFDACNLVPYIRTRAVIAIGLLDDHTPPHAAANAYYQLSDKLREKHLISNPWMGHSSWPELDKIIPRWMKEDSKGKK